MRRVCSIRFSATVAVFCLLQLYNTSVHTVTIHLVKVTGYNCYFDLQVDPADVVIVEGILVLHVPELRDMLNMKIYVDTGGSMLSHDCHIPVT